MYVNIFWFRRDLRIADNAALYHALKGNIPVVPVFIFDKNILDELEDKSDKRVTFIYDAILELQHELLKAGATLEVYYDYPEKVFEKLVSKYSVKNIFVND